MKTSLPLLSWRGFTYMSVPGGSVRECARRRGRRTSAAREKAPVFLYTPAPSHENHPSPHGKGPLSEPQLRSPPSHHGLRQPTARGPRKLARPQSALRRQPACSRPQHTRDTTSPGLLPQIQPRTCHEDIPAASAIWDRRLSQSGRSAEVPRLAPLGFAASRAFDVTPAALACPWRTHPAPPSTPLASSASSGIGPIRARTLPHSGGNGNGGGQWPRRSGLRVPGPPALPGSAGIPNERCQPGGRPGPATPPRTSSFGSLGTAALLVNDSAMYVKHQRTEA